MSFKSQKLLIICFFLLSFCFNLLADTTPIAWYSFDDSSDLGKDFSGNELNGTNYNAEYQTNGVIGSCAYFDGNGQYISVPNNDKLNLTNLTVTFWLKTLDDGYPSGQNRILGKWDNRNYGWLGDLYPNGGVRAAMAYGAGNIEHLIPAKNIGRTKWVNIAITMTPYSCKIYTNGFLSVSTNFITKALLLSNAPLTIGGYDSWGWAWLKGWLDEVKIWDRVLTDEEITKEAEKYINQDPVINITTEATSVTYDVTEIAVTGSNNVNVVGGMTVSNSANQAAAVFDAATVWTAPLLPLNFGENIITVYGTNSYGQSTNDSVLIFRENKLKVLTVKLPDGIIGENYSAVLEAANGDLPYVWNVTSGELPNGISLSVNGALSGIPTLTGLFNFVVRATDKTGGIGEKPLSILVSKNDVSSPRITTTELPDAMLDEKYFVSMKAVGGVPPYLWSVEEGALPNGLHLLSSRGIIEGTPTERTNAIFVIKVTDKNLHSAIMPYVIRVKYAGDFTVTITEISRAKFMINWRKHIKEKDDVDNIYIRMLFEVPEDLVLSKEMPVTVFFGSYPIDGFEAKVTKNGKSAIYHEGSVKNEEFPIVKMIVRIRKIKGKNVGYLYAVVKRADLWGELGVDNENVYKTNLVVPIQLLLGSHEGSTTLEMQYESRKDKKAKGVYPPLPHNKSLMK